MADTALAPSGSETTISITLDGVPLLINAQIDTISEEQVVSEMEHKPLGTTTVVVGQDFGGWRGRFGVKQSSALIGQALDTIEAASRTGLPSVVTLTRTTRFRDLTSETYLYNNCKLSQTSGNRQRGQLDALEIAWRTGDQRVAI